VGATNEAVSDRKHVYREDAVHLRPRIKASAASVVRGGRSRRRCQVLPTLEVFKPVLETVVYL
jgi:hypothetical protein